MSSIFIGKIDVYDSSSQTASVVDTSYGVNTTDSAGVCPKSFDVASQALSIEPPIPGNYHICFAVNGEVYVGAPINPANMSETNNEVPTGLPGATGNTPEEPYTGSMVSRSIGAQRAVDIVPGSSVTRGAGGSEMEHNDSLWKIVMNPALKLILNTVNNIMEVCANNLFFKSTGFELLSETTSANTCNTKITVRRRTSELSSGVPSIELSLGSQANLIACKINGELFFTVDNQRNLDLHVNNMFVDGQLITTENVKRVKLP